MIVVLNQAKQNHHAQATTGVEMEGGGGEERETGETECNRFD